MSEDKPIGVEEHFMRLMANFNDFGQWRIRKAAANGGMPPMVAKLSGAQGHVEVWGGKAHRTEVWFIGKDKSESLVAMDCSAQGATRLSLRDGSLRLAIAQACNLAGIQPKLF